VVRWTETSRDHERLPSEARGILVADAPEASLELARRAGVCHTAIHRHLGDRYVERGLAGSRAPAHDPTARLVRCVNR
jgi:hypothetical protein